MDRPECPYCGERNRLRVASPGMPGWTDPDYICPQCFTASDDGPCFDDLPPAPANVNVDPMASALAYVMFGRLP